MGYLMVIVAMLIWGSLGVFVRWVSLSASALAFYRVLITVSSLSFYAYYNRDKIDWNIVKSRRISILTTGLALAANWIMFFQAIKMTTIANAVLSYYTAPIWITILAPLVVKETIKKKTVSSLFLSIVGIIIMLGPNAITLARNDLFGILLAISAALCYAYIVLMVKKTLNAIPAFTLVLLQNLVALPLLLPFGIGDIPTIYDLRILVIIGLVHTTLAYILYFEGVKRIPVQVASTLSYLDPVSAIIFSFLFLSEIPTINSVFGGALVLLASALLLVNETKLINSTNR